MRNENIILPEIQRVYEATVSNFKASSKRDLYGFGNRC